MGSMKDIDGSYDIILTSKCNDFISLAIAERLVQDCAHIRVAVVEDPHRLVGLSAPHIVLDAHSLSISLLARVGEPLNSSESRSIAVYAESPPEDAGMAVADCLDSLRMLRLLGSMRKRLSTEFKVTFISAKVLSIENKSDQYAIVKALYYGKAERLIKLRSLRLIALGDQLEYSQIVFAPQHTFETAASMILPASHDIRSSADFIFSSRVNPTSNPSVKAFLCSSSKIFRSIVISSEDAKNGFMVSMSLRDRNAIGLLLSKEGIQQRQELLLQEVRSIMTRAQNLAKEDTESTEFVQFRVSQCSKDAETLDAHWDFCDDRPLGANGVEASDILFYEEKIELRATFENGTVSDINRLQIANECIYFACDSAPHEENEVKIGVVNLESRLQAAEQVSKFVISPNFINIMNADRLARKRSNNPPLDVKFALFFLFAIVGVCCIFLALFEIAGAYNGSYHTIIRQFFGTTVNEPHFISTCDARGNVLKF